MATHTDNPNTPKEITNNELSALILNLDKKISDNTETLEQFMATTASQFNRIDQRFNKVDERFDKIDERFEAVDKRFEAIDERFKAVDKRFDEVDASIEALGNKTTVIQKNIFELDERFVTRSEYVRGALTFSLQK